MQTFFSHRKTSSCPKSLTTKKILKQISKELKTKISYEEFNSWLSIQDPRFVQGTRSTQTLQNLIDFHKKYADATSRLKKIKTVAKRKRKNLSELYKIHLIPQQENFKTVLSLLLTELKQNPDLRNKISSVKILQNPLLSQEGLTLKAGDGSRQLFAPIVIYPGNGQDTAQYVLDTLIRILEGQEGLNITPRFNRQINSLIYYSQGDGDFKGEAFEEYYDKDFIHYKSDFVKPGEKVDYSLTI